MGMGSWLLAWGHVQCKKYILINNVQWDMGPLFYVASTVTLEKQSFHYMLGRDKGVFILQENLIIFFRRQ